MASKFMTNSDDHFEELIPLRNFGWHIEVYETNYHFHKRFAVQGNQSIGQLIVLIVKEIGKLILVQYPIFTTCEIMETHYSPHVK